MRKFGLIGYPLSHSFSRKYFTDLFSSEGIGAVYNTYPIEDVSMVQDLFLDPLLEGLNVTIPYKESVIPYLSEVSEAVKEIGACNCIHISEGRRTGYNTDVIGFEHALVPKLKPGHKKALVLGTGGAAKAVYYVLRKLGISYIPVSRKTREGVISYAEVTHEVLQQHTLVINTTPLGMYPDVSGFPPLPYEAAGPGHYFFDLVYNPAVTRFLELACARGAATENGAAMLVVQADESRKIWKV